MNRDELECDTHEAWLMQPLPVPVPSINNVVDDCVLIIIDIRSERWSDMKLTIFEMSVKSVNESLVYWWIGSLETIYQWFIEDGLIKVVFHHKSCVCSGSSRCPGYCWRKIFHLNLEVDFKARNDLKSFKIARYFLNGIPLGLNEGCMRKTPGEKFGF